jgi:hypothetical protein
MWTTDFWTRSWARGPTTTTTITTTKITRVEEMEETTEMVLNRGNVRCYFNKGGNIVDRNSKNCRYILEQLKEECKTFILIAPLVDRLATSPALQRRSDLCMYSQK